MTTKTKPKILSDQALEILVFPAKVTLRCDHAGMQLRDGQEPDVHDEPARADAVALVRDRYLKKCDRFGKTQNVALGSIDDPLRACPSCGFYRTITAAA